MKMDWRQDEGGAAGTITHDFMVEGETDRLTDVLLCAPSHLAPVPCCAATRASLREGFAVSQAQATAQHQALREALEARGVRCHMLPVRPDMPDLCFTRDAGVMTPSGFVALKPALGHRALEVDHLTRTLGAMGVKAARRITEGTIEGGDICIARPGLLILGLSGERTTAEGARAFAEPFMADGWDVVHCAFDPHFLHLDTQFCMLDATHALACVDVLDDDFLAAMAARGINLIPVSYKDAQALGCNVVSLDGRTILMGAGQEHVAARVRAAGFGTVDLDIAQFAACGGGIHCLTMPLRRVRV
ncbi:MAG: arginine deiminase family protein [Sphingobium sp.]